MKWEERKQQQSEKVMVCGDWEMWIHDTWVMLFNNALFASPSACSGENEKDAFRNFLAAIAEYRAKLDKVESEIRQIMEADKYEN